MKYDPEAWAELAKEPGMKYIVITSKHHDGFALWPSEASQWNIADASPYGKDLIGPLAEAARKHGLRFGLLLFAGSGLEQSGRRQVQERPTRAAWDPAQDGDFDAYLDQMALPQVKEILVRYSRTSMWWDTPFQMNPKSGPSDFCRSWRRTRN